jgi:hypothetical protein
MEDQRNDEESSTSSTHEDNGLVSYIAFHHSKLYGTSNYDFKKEDVVEETSFDEEHGIDVIFLIERHR